MLLPLLPPKHARHLLQQALRLLLLWRRGRGRDGLLMLLFLVPERATDLPQQPLRLLLLGHGRRRGRRDGGWRDGLGLFMMTLTTERAAKLVEEAFLMMGVGLGRRDRRGNLFGDGWRDGRERFPAVLVVAVALLVVLAAERVADLVEEGHDSWADDSVW
ncbi:hypothetical protein FB107DRAFT_259347, partial [Schizophyllum commune]